MFKIQLNNPIVLITTLEEDTHIGMATETIFPMDTEDAFMIWNNISIPITYKYDVSIMLNDMIDIIKFMKDENKNKMSNHWASNTFVSEWFLTKNSGQVHIESNWGDTHGNLGSQLNENSELTLDANHFVAELKSMICFVKKCLEKAGYSSKNLKDFYLLEEIVCDVKKFKK